MIQSPGLFQNGAIRSQHCNVDMAGTVKSSMPGPYYATDVIGIYVYRMIGNYEMGWASAAATINAIIIVTMSVVFMRLRERE